MSPSLSEEETCPEATSSTHLPSENPIKLKLRSDLPESFTRDEKLWMYDGSVVINADTTLFRVHRTVLSTHSVFFSDVFSLPQPSEEETYEGCPILSVSDNPVDVHDLLTALYHPDHFERLSTSDDLETALTFISGILRLSTKYLFHYLRSKCITVLEERLPTTFEQYQLQCRGGTCKAERHKLEPLIESVHLANEANVPLILPYTFYCISRKGPQRLLTERSPLDLSWKEKAICLAARELMKKAEMAESHTFLLPVLFQPSSLCRTLCRFSSAPHNEWHALEQAKHPDPLRLFERWNEMNVCAYCIADCYAKHEAGRRKVWELLPAWFGLPSWEELRKNQAAV